jgi:ribokinase
MSSPPPRICVVGSANVDLTFRTPRLPRPGETLAGRHFHLGFGGKGANQAVMAARLGAQVSMIAKVGKDAFGKQMTENLHRERIDTAYVLVDETASSGSAAIMVDDNAQNCIVVVPGANAALSPADIRAAAEPIRTAEVLVCQLEIPLDACLEALRLARDAGVRTVLNPAPAQILPQVMLDLVDVCVPNETEIEIIAGKTVSSVAQARAVAADLGLSRLIVTLGSRGVIVVDQETETHIPARRVTAVDPTGAGDAFTGSLAVYWAQGLSLVDAARKANAVAALSVTRHGAQTGFPSCAEVEAFFAAG